MSRRGGSVRALKGVQRGEKKGAATMKRGDPKVYARFTYLQWVHTASYKPHNSPSGDPYPTNFQIINISVAALLRAS